MFAFVCVYLKKRCVNVKSPTYYFHMKTKILADFQIYISVLLKELLLRGKNIIDY